MGKMKDIFIDQMNRETQNEPLKQWHSEPWPDEIDPQTGKCMWVIHTSKVWANTYKEALDLYNTMIQDQPNEHHEEI